MSFDLCQTKTAKKPFYIESISINIFSMEELCFYLQENLFLIDDSIMNEEFCGWIRDELGMKRLYRQLHEHLEKQQGIMGFILPIFREIGYLDANGMKQLQDSLGNLEVQPVDFRQKMRGDYLVKCGRFATAIHEYRQILERRNPGKLSNQFYAEIWNNLGCAYARQFAFSQAAESFYNGWKMGGSREILKRYISVLPLFLEPSEYQQTIAAIEADNYLISSIQDYNAKRCLEIQKADEMQRFDTDIAEWICRQKEAYRRGAQV